MMVLAVSPNAPTASTSAGTKRGAAEAGATTDGRMTRSKASLVHVTDAVSPLLKLLLEAEQAPEEDASDAPFVPDDVDEPEEEYDEGEIVDDERPPFPDAEYQAADPQLVAQIDGLEDAEYQPDNEPEPEEEYEEGDVVAEEFPLPADAAPEAADPSLVAEIDGAGDDDEGEYEPTEEPEPEEEYAEGDVVDDERPPFVGAEPEAADPALVAQIDGLEDAEYQPDNEPEPEEEYEEGDVVAEEKEDAEEEDDDEDEQ